jgi:hypothetical protein
MGQMPPVKFSATRFGAGVTPGGVPYPGGLDLLTPTLALQPGAMRDCLNFECSQNGGYGRIVGYERFDGHHSPSDAIFSLVQVVSFTNIPSLGDSITQATTGATGVVVAINTVGTPYVILTKVTGTFDFASLLSVGATPIGNATTVTVVLTAMLIAQYTAAAADAYRSDISAVPGSGSLLGVVAMAFANVDSVFAFRNNAGGTAANLYQSSAAGWVQIPMKDEVAFSSGNGSEPADGETLTQGGVTATIRRSVTESGLWTGTAAGRFIIDSPSGGNFAAGAATASGGASITLGGAQTAIVLQPNGRYEFDKYNFGGQSSSRRIYGADGVNRGFEFDGTTLVPIDTGLDDDRPSHVCCHKNILFFSKDSSVIYSGPGVPYQFSALAGGGEIAAGSDVTGMATMPGAQTTAALGIYLAQNTSILYGTDSTTFNYVSFNTGQGALRHSVQNLSDTFVLSSQGVTTMKTSLNYGNFVSNMLTKNITPLIERERSKLSASSIYRAKSQYRLFFNDGYGIWITYVNGQYIGAGVTLFPNPVSCIDEEQDSSGDEVVYFGSSDGNGYVYQMERGTSLDGQDLNAYFIASWDFLRSPRILKRFRSAMLEVQGDSYALISFGYSLDYGSQNTNQPLPVSASTGFSNVPMWDAFTWDHFTWDGFVLAPTEVDMTGTADNVQLMISSGTNYIAAYNVNSVIYAYTPRRGKRV